MNHYSLIDQARETLNGAESALNNEQLETFAEQMQLLLDLLIEELVGSAPRPTATPSKTFNPEVVLNEIAIAIKHRTISHTHRWKIIYYHTRLTCVPIEANVPDKIVLHEFTENMVNNGFSVTYWNQLKQNVIKLYKELKS